MPRGGKREGAGRPPGSRDSKPRVTRQAVLSERKELFDAHYDASLWPKIKKRLEDLIESGTARDAVKAIEIAMKYGMGVPGERSEPKPAPVFNFLVQSSDGSVKPLALPAPQEQPQPAEDILEGQYRELPTQE